MIEATIQKFSLKGRGIADDVEIAHTIPGDRIIYELKRKRRPKKGRLLEVIGPSQNRVAPKCIHATVCGGCSWQQMSYEAQLQEKEARVKKAFGVAPQKIIPCEKIFGYRNKMEFTFSENRAGERFFGLMIAAAEPYVFNLTECHLANSWFSDIVNAARIWWVSSGLKAYYPPADTGSLRYLTIREAMRTGQKMVVLNVSGNPEFALSKEQIASFKTLFNDDISLFLRIHQTKKGKPTQFFEMHLAGPDHIVEQMHLKAGVFSFKISPSSFFQPNTLAAETLYDLALKNVGECEVVYDLYCGTGTLGMAASRVAKQVVGIELSPEAVLDAEENKKRNNVTNFTIHQGDVGKVLEQIKYLPPDCILVDPPRAGLDELAMKNIKNLQAPKIVYISCNPLTQAENVKNLSEFGYKIKELQPIDQFPHTYHIENIAVLEL